MPNPKPVTLTPELVAAHERLYPRLAALLKQVERVAGRRAGAVPAETVALAKSLCDEARKLLGREGRGIVLSKTPDATGLALALGQAVAALETFEAEHTAYEGIVLNWQLADGSSSPVGRAKPKAAPSTLRDTGRSIYDPTPEEMRSTVLKRIIQRENAVYMKGYRDAQDGKPPREPRDEIEII